MGIESFTNVASVAALIGSVAAFIGPVVSKDDGVIVRTSGGFTVFATDEVAEFNTSVFPKTFHEVLEVFFDQSAVSRDVLLVIGQGDERVDWMELGFVNEAGLPFGGPVQAAADAVTARDFHPSAVNTEILAEYKRALSGGVDLLRAPYRYRRVAGHSLMPPRIGLPLRFFLCVFDAVAVKSLRDFFPDKATRFFIVIT